MNGWRRTAAVVLPIALAAVLMVVVFPRVTGTSWDTTFDTLGTLSVVDLALLTVVWFLGLCAYTLVLRASLPSLTVPQALTLNLGGSAVSNLVPFGGALGVALNFAMTRSWGFRRSSFAASTALTTVANVVTKLALPVAGAAAVASSGHVHDRTLAVTAWAAAGLLVLVVTVIAFSVTDNVLARFVTTHGQRLGGVLERRFAGRRLGAALTRRTVALGRDIRTTARAGWRRMLGGMFAYSALQALLLWLVLAMLHSRLSLPVVFAGFAFERALTLVVVTPGGVGVAQTGAAAVLIALGGDPVTVAAGVVLYSTFTFFLEIPVGGVVAARWWASHRSRPGASAGDPGAAA